MRKQKYLPKSKKNKITNFFRVQFFLLMLLTHSISYCSVGVGLSEVKHCSFYFGKFPVYSKGGSSEVLSFPLFFSLRELALLHEPGSMESLRQLGVGPNELAQMVHIQLKQDLDKLESLAHFWGEKKKSDNFSWPKFSERMPQPLKKFAEQNQLMEEIEVTHTMDPRNDLEGILNREVVERALKAILLTDQNQHLDLIVKVAVGQKALDTLARFAIEFVNENLMLMVGRLAIARYVYFDREPNFLYTGLMALSGIKSNLMKRNAREILISFSQLASQHLHVSASIGNESETSNRKRGQYLSDALKSLLAAGDVVFRYRVAGDQIHQVVHLQEEEVKGLMRNLINEMIEAEVIDDHLAFNFALFSIGDPEFTKDIAHKVFVHRKALSNPGFQPTQLIREQSFINMSLNLALLSKDIQFIKEHFKIILDSLISDNMKALEEYLPLYDLTTIKGIKEEIEKEDLGRSLYQPKQQSYKRNFLIWLNNIIQRINGVIGVDEVGFFLEKKDYWQQFGFYGKSIKKFENNSPVNGLAHLSQAIYNMNRSEITDHYNNFMESKQIGNAIYAAIALFVLERGSIEEAKKDLLNPSLKLTNLNLTNWVPSLP